MPEIIFTHDELKDHDLLVRMDEKLNQLSTSRVEFVKLAQEEFEKIWHSIDTLRMSIEQVKEAQAIDRGQKSGVQWMLNLLTALPAGLIGYIFGGKII